MLWKPVTLLLVTVFPSVVISANGAIVQSQTAIAVPYKAPLRGDWPEKEIVPDIFNVTLAPGHSLEAHSEAIHRDLTPYISGIVHDSDKDRVLYAIKRVDDELLEAIRADLGVEEVWRDARAHPLSGPVGDEAV